MWWKVLLVVILFISIFILFVVLYKREVLIHYYNRMRQRNWDQLNFKKNTKLFFLGKAPNKLNSEIQPISIRTSLKRSHLKTWKDVTFEIKYSNQVGNTILVQDNKPLKTKELELFAKFYTPFIFLNVINKQPFSYIIFYSEEETYKSIANFLRKHNINVYKVSHKTKQEKNEYWLEGNYYNLLKIIWEKYNNNENYISDLDNLIDQLMIMIIYNEKVALFKQLIFSIVKYLLDEKTPLAKFNFANILKTWKKALSDKNGDFIKKVGIEWIFKLENFTSEKNNKNVNLFDFYFKVFQDVNDFNYEFPYDEINFEKFHTTQSIIFLKSDQWIFHPIKEVDNPQPINIQLAKQLITYKSTIKDKKTLKTMVFIPSPTIYNRWKNFDLYLSKSKADEVNYFLKVTNINLFFMSYSEHQNKEINLMGQAEIFPHLYVFDNSTTSKVIDQKVVDGYSVAKTNRGTLSRIFFGLDWVNDDIVLAGDHLYKYKNSIFLHERLDYIDELTQMVFGNDVVYQTKHLLDIHSSNETNKQDDYDLELEDVMQHQIIYSRDEKNDLINKIFDLIKTRANLNGKKRNQLKVDLEKISFNEITYRRIIDLLKEYNVSIKVINILIEELIQHYKEMEDD